MTLPDERYRALTEGKKFLYDLLNPQKTPKVPKTVRNRALSILRHYPDDYHIEMISENLPNFFSKDYWWFKSSEKIKNED